MRYGIQEAEIQSSFITVKDNGTVEVCHKLRMIEDGNRVDFTRIYITEKSKGIARAQFRACGYDGDDFQDILDAVDADGEALKGNKVKVDVFNNEYNNKPKVEIVTERKKAGPDALRRAAELLRDAKGQHDDANDMKESDIPF